MFTKWVKNRLIPLFKRTYPGKIMNLILDNAPYHHKRGIPSLTSMSKGKIVDEMSKYMGPDDAILLPINE